MADANYLVATTPGKKIQVKANKKPNFVIPGRTNGKVYIPPKLGNTFRNLVATTPRTGTHGRGLGTKKGGRRSHRRKSRKH